MTILNALCDLKEHQWVSERPETRVVAEAHRAQIVRRRHANSKSASTASSSTRAIRRSAFSHRAQRVHPSSGARYTNWKRSFERQRP